MNKLMRFIFGGIFLVSEIASFSFSFLAGYHSRDVKLESIAEYASKVAVNQTEAGIFAMTLGAKDRYESLLPVDHELHRLYGIFKQEKITFASSINATKENHDIILDSDLSSNLSIMYLGALGSFKYKDHYKHIVFPLESMFEDDPGKAYKISNYICYLSKTQATRLLNKRRGNPSDFSDYNDDDYKSLLYTSVDIAIDGTNLFPFSIINIYFEDNYYCWGLNTVMGEFIACSYYLPMNLRSLQRSMYFMSKYTYQNQYFMNYINATYAGDNFFLTVDNYNVRGTVNESLLFEFRNENTISNTLSNVYLTFSIFLLIPLLVSSLFIKKRIYTFAALIFPALVYCFFKTIYRVTGNVRWFSFYSCKIYFWLYFSLIIIAICIWLFRYARNNYRNSILNMDEYYETDI